MWSQGRLWRQDTKKVEEIKGGDRYAFRSLSKSNHTVPSGSSGYSRLPLWMRFVSGELLPLQCCGFALEAIEELVLHI